MLLYGALLKYVPSSGTKVGEACGQAIGEEMPARIGGLLGLGSLVIGMKPEGPWCIRVMKRDIRDLLGRLLDRAGFLPRSMDRQIDAFGVG